MSLLLPVESGAHGWHSANGRAGWPSIHKPGVGWPCLEVVAWLAPSISMGSRGLFLCLSSRVVGLLTPGLSVPGCRGSGGICRAS